MNKLFQNIHCVLNHKTKASIVEQMVTLLIVVIVISSSFHILTKVIVRQQHALKLKASVELNRVMLDTQRKQDFFESEITTEAGTVQRRIKIYKKNPRLKIVILRYINANNKPVLTRKRTFYVPEND